MRADASQRRAFQLRLALLAAFIAAALGYFSGWLRPIDDYLRDLRFALDGRDATGDIVLVEIDAAALEAVGVWPWPRSVHAELLNRLLDLGASEVAFDIDFSQPSVPAEDAAFEAALEEAGGYAMLPAFRQLAKVGDGPIYTTPLPQFAQHASIVAVNVATDGAGAVRAIPLAMDIGGMLIPSLPAALAGASPVTASEFVIDYSIAAERIDRVSVADVLAGKVDPLRIADRQVVIGASALELRDVMMAPSHGPLPGAMIQILGAESLKQGRALFPVTASVWLAIAAGAALLVLAFNRRLALPPGIGAVIATAASTEALAFWLQSGMAMLVDTAGLQLALAASLVVALAAESFERRRLHLEAMRSRMEALEELAERARHDTLTGALTRQEFCRRADEAIARTPSAAVICFSLTRFAKISEALGHAVGELVLRQVVQRMPALGEGDLARVSGDTFAFRPAAAAARAEIEALCLRLRDVVTAPYEAEGHQAIVGCTIGFSISPGTHAAAAVLLSQAEMARSAAAASPALPFVVYEPGMDERVASQRVMELALREAVGQREIAVHYQGQVDLRTGALVGAEALSRWHHPVLGAVSPMRFFSLAEETGLVVELGAQVMAAACQEVSGWPKHVRVAVNVSPSQFELDDIPARVSQCLETYRLDPRRLDLEITEGMLLTATPGVLNALERIRQMGVGIAIDDFGTGYSSLAYLGTLPVDKVKIDQSFTRKLMVDPRTDAIVEAILALCRRLGLAVVAEGIETREQADWLRARQCEFGQGYLFHRAVAGAEMRASIAGAVQRHTALV